MKLKAYIVPGIIILAAVCSVIYFQNRKSSLYDSLNERIASNAKEAATEKPSPIPAAAPGINKKTEKTKTATISPQGVAKAAATTIPLPLAEGIDPVLLAQAELELLHNQLYEEEAKATLPTLSVQTHNPVWQLEYEEEQPRKDVSSAEETTEKNKPKALATPEAGAFGNIQPPEGEIWLRIPVDYSTEHRDIMAQHADLFRIETGYTKPVTVTLWVGGRPYARQMYE